MDGIEELQPNSTEIPVQETESNEISLLWIEEGIDTVISTVYVYLDGIKKKLRAVLWEPSPELKSTGMLEFPVETKWSVPTKAQIDGYRDKSSRYNTIARAVLIQRVKLEELLIQNHLLEVKLGSNEHQTVVDLQRDKRGALTVASLTHINRLHPSVIEMVLAKFIDEAALIL